MFLWDSNLAYAVGLITTDGCLSKDGRHIDFTSKDREQIETFIEIFKLKNKIGLKSSSTSSKKYFRVQFGDVELYKFLISKGLMIHKSKILGAVQVPDIYFRDFLRGHLDGDGSIIFYTDRYNSYKGTFYQATRLMIYFLSASQTHILWLQSKIALLLGIKGSVNVSPPRSVAHASMWTLKFSKKDSIEMINWLYYRSDLPSLKRKKSHAMEAIRIIKQEKRKEYTKVA